jgi:DNA-binding NarL/FixJ family response regulator
VTDTKKARDLIEKTPPDIVILDLSSESSKALYHTIKTAYPDLKLILLAEDNSDNASDMGVSYFLRKPIMPDSLMGYVDKVLFQAPQ